MAEPYEATAAFLDDRPDLADAVGTLVDLDADGPWAFEDVPFDSGTFGELVSRDFVREVDGGYRLADRAAVAAALRGEPNPADGGAAGGTGRPGIGSDVGPGIAGRFADRFAGHNPQFGLGLLVALGFLLLMRLLTYPRVFRDGGVYLPGNDPYHYRHWVDQLLAADPGPLALGEVTGVLGRRASGEPLVYALGWWATAAGGAPESSGAAVAWLPVAAALFVGLATGLIALWVTDDERIALLAVGALALTPAHALYSGIGFFDHHAFDYAWLSAMAAAVVWLATDLDRRRVAAGPRGRPDPGAGPDPDPDPDPDRSPIRAHLAAPATWLAAAVLGVAAAAATFSWDGSPVLFVGLAGYAVARPGLDLRAGVSPLPAALPLLAGLGLGAALSHLVHASAGWQEPAVAYTPAVALGVALAAAGLAAAAARLDLRPRWYAAGGPALAAAVVAGVRLVRPTVPARLLERAGTVVRGTRREAGIAESRTLLSADYGVIFGSVDMFGWLLFLALPALAWATYRCWRAYEPRWLAVCSYAWALLAFSLFEIRFTGELSPFAAVLTATAVAALFGEVDLVAAPSLGSDRGRVRFRIDPRTLPSARAAYLSVALVLVASLSLFLVPAIMGSVAQDDGTVAATEWIAADAADRDGPEFVLSRWGRNRAYNYHVAGESDEYSYALSNYEPFLASTDPDGEYYDQFRGRVGYVAVSSLGDRTEGDLPAEVAYGRLYDRLGSAGGGVDGVGHYRAAFVAPDRSVVVFRVVPGATITGTAADADADGDLVAETDVSIPNAAFTYRRHVDPAADGSYNVTVAHPGTYEVGGETVTVTETDVREGATVEAG